MDIFKHEYITSQFYNTDTKLTDKQTILLNKLLLDNNYIISQFGFEDVMYVDNSTLHQIIDFIIGYDKGGMENHFKTIYKLLVHHFLNGIFKWFGHF